MQMFGKKKNKQNSRQKKTKVGFNKLGIIYGICMLGMTAVLVTALFAPQFIFSIQDKYRMESIQTQERGTLDVGKLNLGYERQIRARMINFAGKANYDVVAIDYGSEELAEVLPTVKNFMYNEAFMPLYVAIDSYGYTSFIDSSLLAYELPYDDMTECKKYVIYNDDFQEGITLMVWYMKFEMPNGICFRLLIDAETGTFYYLRITDGGDGKEQEVYSAKKRTFFDINEEFVYYYSSYYGADIDSTIFYDDGGNSQIAESGTIKISVEPVEPNGNIFKFPLVYGDLSLNFSCILKVIDSKEMNIEMGITQIGKLIPEMVQE